jgi:hypothetical protein
MKSINLNPKFKRGLAGAAPPRPRVDSCGPSFGFRMAVLVLTVGAGTWLLNHFHP